MVILFIEISQVIKGVTIWQITRLHLRITDCKNWLEANPTRPLGVLWLVSWSHVCQRHRLFDSNYPTSCRQMIDDLSKLPVGWNFRVCQAHRPGSRLCLTSLTSVVMRVPTDLMRRQQLNLVLRFRKSWDRGMKFWVLFPCLTTPYLDALDK